MRRIRPAFAGDLFPRSPAELTNDDQRLDVETV
jgi:hypothetical protein